MDCDEGNGDDSNGDDDDEDDNYGNLKYNGDR